MSRDYRLRVSSSYFLYLYVQKYKSVASVGPPGGRGPVCLAHSAHPIATPLLTWIHQLTDSPRFDLFSGVTGVNV